MARFIVLFVALLITGGITWAEITYSANPDGKRMDIKQENTVSASWAELEQRDIILTKALAEVKMLKAEYEKLKISKEAIDE